MLRRIYFLFKNFLFDLVFPRNCIGCGAEGDWICRECLKTIDVIRQPFCSECRKPTEIGEFCENCHPRFALDGIFICANFGEGVLKEAIHHFKYNYIFNIGEILGKIMAGKLKNTRSLISCSRITEKQELEDDNILRFDLVIPVPLHKKRFRERGFNQSEILAREIHRSLGRGLINQAPTIGLERIKYTVPQAELDREQRLENLKDVFVWSGKSDLLVNKNILLVDDVTTTGTTLEECAKVLKINGAKSVWGIVLAKGK